MSNEKVAEPDKLLPSLASCTQKQTRPDALSRVTPIKMAATSPLPVSQKTGDGRVLAEEAELQQLLLLGLCRLFSSDGFW